MYSGDHVMKANGKRKSEASCSRKISKEFIADEGMEKYDKFYMVCPLPEKIEVAIVQNFERPPFAPVYTPTIEEFADPIEYVAKIRPEAEKYGVVKIIPPEGFKPPFVLDLNEFTFSPRIQKLNEIEAIIKEKATFTQRLVNYNRLNGMSYNVPVDKDGTPIDLHRLHRIIQSLGGFYIVDAEDLWKKVAAEMMCNKPATSSFIKLIKTQYENHVEPFVRNLKERAPLEDEESDVDEEEEVKQRYQHHHGEYDPENVKKKEESPECPQSMQGGRRRAGDGRKKPKGRMMAGLARRESHQKTRARKKSDSSNDPMDTFMCKKCKLGDNESSLLICDVDQCGIGMHTYCCDPPFEDVPTGDWRCPSCIQAEDAKIGMNWGFRDADATYSLASFKDFANNFKCKYFGVKDETTVDDKLVEKEFWRNVYSSDSVSVKYGADLITNKVGSGFPRKTDDYRGPDARVRQHYANHPWNLNNMPVLKDSILSHIETDISGMIVPWIYVGMCFSTFCWHTEDHWTYSVNYNHWGERKIWYGIGGDDAEKFEDAVRKLAPGLTGRQIDLFHHMTTAANPALLRSMGVPIHTVHQNAGEFVITFPRAYHAGFNEGLNVAEAVNFAPIDWLSKGRHCIAEYSNVRRFCVFSHDEVVLKMVSACNKLGIAMSVAALDELMEISKREHQLRSMVAGVGIVETKQAVIESWPDEQRECRYCRTTVFLSCIGCPHGHIACLEHFDRVCKSCDKTKCTLFYRYTMEEMLPMVEKLELRTTEYYEWTDKVEHVLHILDKPKISDVEKLLDAAKQKKFPATSHVFSLQSMRAASKSAIEKANSLLSGKVRVRNKTRCQRADTRLDIDGLISFIEEVKNAPCDIDYLIGDLEDFLERLRAWQTKARKVVEEAEKHYGDPSCPVTIDQLSSLIEEGNEFDVKTAELDDLSRVTELKKWNIRVSKLLSWQPFDSTEDLDDFESRGRWPIDHVLKLSSEGASLFPSSSDTEEECPATRLHAMMRIAKVHDNEAAEFLENPSLEGLDAIWDKIRHSDWCLSENLNKVRADVINARKIRVKLLEKKTEGEEDMADVFYSLPSTSTLSSNVLSYSDVDLLHDMFIESKVLQTAPLFTEVCDHRAKVNEFTRRIQQLFKQKNPYYNLYDIISEREDLEGLIDGENPACFLLNDDEKLVDPLEEWKQLESFDLDDLTKKLNELHLRRADSMKQLRQQNQEKTANVSCVCVGSEAKKKQSCELQCLNCNGKFHVGCCDWNPVLATLPDGVYLCVRCLRGRRPAIEDVQAVLNIAPENSLELHLVKYAVNRSRDITKELMNAAADYIEGQRFGAIQERMENALLDWISCELVNMNALPKVQQLLPSVFQERLNAQKTELIILRSRPVRKQVLPALFVSGGKRKRNSMGAMARESRKDRKKLRIGKVPQEHEEGEEARCSAPMCFEPVGLGIKWVQCEAGCSNWYHCKCVNFRSIEEANNEVYECFNCKAGCEGSSSSSSSSSSENQMSKQHHVSAPAVVPYV